MYDNSAEHSLRQEKKTIRRDERGEDTITHHHADWSKIYIFEIIINIKQSETERKNWYINSL